VLGNVWGVDSCTRTQPAAPAAAPPCHQQNLNSTLPSPSLASTLPKSHGNNRCIKLVMSAPATITDALPSCMHAASGAPQPASRRHCCAPGSAEMKNPRVPAWRCLDWLLPTRMVQKQSASGHTTTGRKDAGHEKRSWTEHRKLCTAAPASRVRLQAHPHRAARTTSRAQLPHRRSSPHALKSITAANRQACLQLQACGLLRWP